MADLVGKETTAGRASQPVELRLATVEAYNSYYEPKGVSVIFDGEETPTTKRFMRLATDTSLSKGNRVLVAKVSGTYIVLGKVGYGES